MNVLALSRPPVATPTPILAIDTARFEAWLQTARPGSLIEYHRGHLCVDRQQKFDATEDAPDDKARAVLHDLATRALRGLRARPRPLGTAPPRRRRLQLFRDQVAVLGEGRQAREPAKRGMATPGEARRGKARPSCRWC